MAHRIQRDLLLAAIGLAAALAVVPPRHSACGTCMSNGSNHAALRTGGRSGRRQVRDLPPNALPGTQAHKRSGDALQPAQRGDVAERCAVRCHQSGRHRRCARRRNRGADFDATNVLGLTPIDLSVDLGRNDITMFLLSLRGADKSTNRLPPRRRTRRRSPCSAVAARRAAAASRGGHARPVSGPTRARSSADPGTPTRPPGFLGFGGVHADRITEPQPRSIGPG